MKIDHFAYRVNDRHQHAKRLRHNLGYHIRDEIFIDALGARSYIMTHDDNPEIFVSDGEKGSIIWNWVFDRGPGLHHVAYAVDDVVDTMIDWGRRGIEFISGPLYCPCEIKLVQVFTKEKPFGHIVELIERNGHMGFCEHNIQRLMESTDP